MVSDEENTTNRKRPDRLQQKTRVRSRSPAVTHSIYGNIHSRERIKIPGKRGRRAPQTPPRQHGDYHGDGSPAIRGEIPSGRSASSGLRSAVPSAPAEGGLLPADRSPSGPSKHTLQTSFAQSLLSVIQGRVGYAAGAALFVFGERSLTHSHTLSCDYHVLQKCDKAQQLRAVAPPPLGSFAFSLPTLDLFSGFAPPTFNPFKDLPVDSPVQTREQGAHYSSSDVGCGALNTNAFAGMIKSYKLHNEPFISISRVPNEGCRSLFPGSSPLWSRSFGLLLPTNLTLSPILSSVPTLRLFFFSPSPTFLICLMLCS